MTQTKNGRFSFEAAFLFLWSCFTGTPKQNHSYGVTPFLTQATQMLPSPPPPPPWTGSNLQTQTLIQKDCGCKSLKSNSLKSQQMINPTQGPLLPHPTQPPPATMQIAWLTLAGEHQRQRGFLTARGAAQRVQQLSLPSSLSRADPRRLGPPNGPLAMQKRRALGKSVLEETPFPLGKLRW